MGRSSSGRDVSTAAHSAARTVAPDGTDRERRVTELPLFFWLFIAGMAANIFSGHSDELGLPISPDRFLLPAAMVLAVLDDKAGPPLRNRMVYWGLGVFAAVATWSALGHGVMQDSVAAFALLDRVLLPTALFIVAPRLLATTLRRTVFLWLLTLVGAYLAVTSVGQTLNVSALVWPPYARDLTDGPLGSGAPTGVHRAGGPFLAAEANGIALVMCAFAAAALTSATRSLRQAFAAVVAISCLAASLLTMTRSVWASGLLAIVIVSWSTPAIRRRWPLLLIAAVAAVGAILLMGMNDVLLQRATQVSSVYDRIATNDAALRIMAERPLDGVGWRQFVDSGWDWVRQGDTHPLAHTHIEVHNVFLARGAELGTPAALLFVLCVLNGPLAAVVRPTSPDLSAWQPMALGIFVVWLVPSLLSPNPYPFPNFVMWTVTGLLLPSRLATPAARARRLHSQDASATAPSDEETVHPAAEGEQEEARHGR
ncbi:MAG TPA: O-antigen ligase family protein [Dermatophilaceae bacterium]|nr:O-antigen ligase family protein [Dermatophilaceae bacterium]